MKIIDRIQPGRRFISLEFFPPKQSEEWPKFFNVVGQLKALDPLFASVTYGAGGGTQDNTLEIAGKIKQDIGLEPMAHLTCVGADEQRILNYLKALEQRGVDNVLALRGDPPRGVENFEPENEAFQHASDLAIFIRENMPNFGVAVAAYPEIHPESRTVSDDLRWMQFKMEHADLAVTQLFFDNRAYVDFVERLKKRGVEKPVIPGVMPLLSMSSIRRILSMCSANIPGKLFLQLDEANEKGGNEAVRELGIAFAIRQARELLEMGAPGIHLYTLNKSAACLEIAEGFKDLL